MRIRGMGGLRPTGSPVSTARYVRFRDGQRSYSYSDCPDGIITKLFITIVVISLLPQILFGLLILIGAISCLFNLT